MERIPIAIYTKELREEAVKLVTEGGFSIPEVGRRLSVFLARLGAGRGIDFFIQFQGI